MRVAVVVAVAVAWVGCGRAPPGPTGRPSPSTTEPSLSGGQSGEDGSGTPCWPTETPGDADDVVAGSGGPVTAADLRGLAGGRFTGTLTWTGGASTPLTVELAWTGSVRLVDTDCDPSRAPDVIRVDGTVSFVTGDGALAESGPAVLIGAGPGSASVSASWTEGALSGSFVFPDDGGATSVLAMAGTADAGGLRGDLRVAAALSGGSGAHGTAGASIGEAVGQYGVARAPAR